MGAKKCIRELVRTALSGYSKKSIVTSASVDSLGVFAQTRKGKEDERRQLFSADASYVLQKPALSSSLVA